MNLKVNWVASNPGFQQKACSLPSRCCVPQTLVTFGHEQYINMQTTLAVIELISRILENQLQWISSLTLLASPAGNGHINGLYSLGMIENFSFNVWDKDILIHGREIKDG